MNCSVGDSLAEYGFSFFEKLHSPIFLVHKSGEIKKINEAGRKLLKIASPGTNQVQEWAQCLIAGKRIETNHKPFKVISRPLGQSEYFLVELLR